MSRVSGVTETRKASRRPAGPGRPDLLLVAEFKQALRQPGCPLCRRLREVDLHYLRVFLREGKNDGRVRLRLLASWGLCARHAGALVHLEPVERGDGLGTGTLYDWLLDQARRLLDDLRRDFGTDDLAGSPQWRRRRTSRKRVEECLSRLARRSPCPACEAQEWYAAYIAAEFVRALEPAAKLHQIREMYLASDALCLPHWRAVEGLLSRPDVRAPVADKQREVVASLKAALDAALARGVAGEGGEDGAPEDPAYARALAAVAGDTVWQPDER